ncbi:MAG TPA: MFS transporter [Aliidongia sp.]|uniref:MFS transporter n=1 Tax=Aliidongia sp. TaxID=1914230 RepID=UPI002DDCE167|nr:MFS transporter [Aliidongia sp.]HEV2674773.1 MFS transporter [Aliidongia sp.]
MTVAMGAGGAVAAAGFYFARPLADAIGQDIGLAPAMAGLIVTVGQLGYCSGLLAIAPLCDLVENRKLLLFTLAAATLSLVAAATARSAFFFLLAMFAIGAASVAAQMLVSFASFLSRPATRGQVVGDVTGTLLLGILLAWPVACVAASYAGWRTLFALNAAVVVAICIVLARKLPRRTPDPVHGYTALIASLWQLLRSTPELWRHATIQALLYGAYSLFWTTVPLELSVDYALGPLGIALFGLTGLSGALAAPLAGRIGDRGLSRFVGTTGAMTTVGAFLLVITAGRLWMFVLAAICLDAGVQANFVISQRAILALRPAAASRLNSLFIAILFLGGAIGSAIAIPLHMLGRPELGGVGLVLATAALALWQSPGQISRIWEFGQEIR